MQTAADPAPPAKGETGTEGTGLPAAGGEARAANSFLPLPEDDTPAGAARAPDAPPAAPPASPPPRRIFGTVLRKPEVLAAELAIV